MKLMLVKGSTEKVTMGKNGVQVDQHVGLSREYVEKAFPKAVDWQLFVLSCSGLLKGMRCVKKG